MVKITDKYNGQCDRSMYGTVKRSIISSSKAVGDHYTRTSRKSGKETNNGIDDTVCRTNSCQSSLTDKISHNNTVNSIIKLLEQVAHKRVEGQNITRSLVILPSVIFWLFDDVVEDMVK